MKLAQTHFTKITKLLAIGLLFFAISALVFHSKTDAVAGINRTVNFQGKLINNPLKTNVSDTSYTVVFTIYDNSTGGTALWTETQSVTTADGIFRVELGSVTPFPSNFNFNWDGLYLGIKVNADSEMTPRVRLTAVPYAFNAEKVAGLTVQDTAGNASTSGTLQIPNAKTINLGTQNLTFSTSGDTTLTLPTTGTLATLAGSEILTNKSIGSTGLVFSGATTDITTATDEDLTITPNGSGDLIVDLTSSGEFYVRDSGNNFAQFLADGTITLGKAATAGTLNLGIGTGADILNIGSDNTSGDTLVIGNDNASTTLSLIGGDDWSITTAGAATLASLSGAGLSDCDAADSKILWNDATGTFSCGTEVSGSGEDVQANITAISDTSLGSSATSLGTVSITPTNNTGDVVVRLSFSTLSSNNADQTITAQIRDGANCSGTILASNTSSLTSSSNANGPSVYVMYLDVNPGNTSQSYTACGLSTINGGASATGGIISAEVIDTSPSGGGSGSIAVRESDGSPSVGAISTLEFGPATASEEDFIVTDQGGGTARVELGSQIARLGDAETVTGNWIFNNSNTTFSSALYANSGIWSSSGSDLSLIAGGTGDIEINLDFDSNLQITGTQAPGIDMINLTNVTKGTTTDGVDGLQIDFVTSAVAGNRTNAALRMNLTSGATEAGDTLYGLLIGNLTGQTGTETAISIGTGWDNAIVTNNGNINAGTGILTAGSWDAAGATALTLGSGDVLSLTVTTDSTGDAEVVLPDESIGAAEITNNSLTPTDFAAIQTYSDGDFLDLASILHDDSVLQGLRLPQNTSLTNPVSGEGFLAYNSNTNLVQVFNGTSWTSISGESGASTLDELYAASVTATDTILDVDDASGLTFDLTTTGDFIIQDNSTAFAIFSNDGSISLGKASIDSTINIGTGTGIDTINIGTGAGGADVLTLGGNTGTIIIDGTNFHLSGAGIITMSEELILSSIDGEGISGGGLSDCDGETDKLQWDSTTNKFSCGTDSNVSAVFDAYDNTGGDAMGTGLTVNLDTIRKNSNGGVFSLSADELTIDAAGTYTFQYRVSGTLASGTRGAFRAYLEEDTGSGFAEVDGSRAYGYGRITTYPEATAVGFVTLDVASGSAYRVRALNEAETFNTVADGSNLIVTKLGAEELGGSSGGINGVNVRESDGSPTVTEATAIEFGPASSNVDFVVTDQGGGIARVVLGSGVAKLADAQTVTGGWTFNTAATTFSTATTFTAGILANGGIDTTGNTDLTLDADGTGDIKLISDFDTAVLIGSATTPAPLSIAGGIGGNSALIVDQLNSGDIFTASSSGTTRFIIDNSGNLNLFGGTISDNSDGVDIDDDLDVSGTINLTTGNLAFSSTGGITFNGGTISDALDEVDINDDLSVAGSISLSGNIQTDGGTISDASGDVSIDDDLSISGATGISLTSYGADLIFANFERVSNDTDGTITLGRNNTGTVTLNAADDDSTAEFIIQSGGDALLSLDTGTNGTAGVSIGATNANSVTIGNTDSGTGLTFSSGTGGINIGDNANTKAIEIGGVDSDGSDTVRISTNASSADSINIGNANAGTVVDITGGNDWSVTGAGAATFASLSGAGLSTCNGATDVLRWNAGSFSCGTVSSDPDTATFNDSSADIGVSFTTPTDVWDGTQPNITPTSTSQTVLVSVVIHAVDNTNSDANPTFQIRRNTGANATCASTQVGIEFQGGWSTTTGDNMGTAATFLDSPGTTSETRYTVCTGSTGESTGTVTNIQVTLVALGADLAENYYTTDESIGPGDVVSIDAALPAGVKKSGKRYDSQVLGVVSTVPKITMDDAIGMNYGRPVPVALAGRIPVKVSTENGRVKAGDLLTSSSVPGVAMKATKAGQIIGQALQDFSYPDGEVGLVLTFVKTDYFTGSSVSQIALDQSSGLTGEETGTNLLTYLLQNPTSFEQDSLDMSEVNTDRVIAGLEMVTPRVVADEILVSTIKPAEKDVVVILDENNTFKIGNSSSSAGVVFDGDGNAEFSGTLRVFSIEVPTLTVDTLIAGKIRADQIEGLEFVNSKLAELETRVATIGGELTERNEKFDAQAKLMESLSEKLAESTKSSELTNPYNLQGLSSETSSISGNLRIRGNGLVEGILSVVDTIIANNLVLNGLATFFDDAVFKAKVAFEGSVTFSSDMGGAAIIEVDDKRVDVVFENEFEDEPIVNVSITFDEEKDEDGNVIPTEELEQEFFNEKYSYIIVNKSKRGFTIVLNKEAKDNVNFTWTALNIKESKSFQSRLSDY